MPIAKPTMVFVEVDGGPRLARWVLRMPNGSLVDVDGATVGYVPKFVHLADVGFTSLVGLGGQSIAVKADESGLEVVPTYALESLSPTLVFAEDVPGERITAEHFPHTSIHCFAAAPFTGAVIPAAVAEWPNRQRRTWIDLTHATECRLVVSVSSPAYSAGSKLAVRYATTDGGTYGYLDGSNGPFADVDGANSNVKGAWVPIEAGAKADVSIQLVGRGGNNTDTATIGTIEFQYR